MDFNTAAIGNSETLSCTLTEFVHMVWIILCIHQQHFY